MRLRTVITVAGAATAVLGVLSITVALRAGADEPRTSSAVPAAAPEAAAPAWGDVIPTGIEDGGSERVFYVVPVDIAELPQVHLGVMAGRRDSGGGLAADLLTNETVGADRSDGFHSVWGGIGPDGTSVPAFGYYVGPAAKITARMHGRVVTAAQAVWSEDARLVVFWFDPADLRGGPPGELAAFDAAGEPLPAGDTSVSVG